MIAKIIVSLYQPALTSHLLSYLAQCVWKLLSEKDIISKMREGNRSDMNLGDKVSKYMKKQVAYVEPDSTLSNVALALNKAHTDVAIVQSDGEVSGLVTADDIFYAMRSYILGQDLLEKIPSDLRNVKVKELMRSVKALDFMEVCALGGVRVCFNITENDTIANAIRVLGMTGVSHLLVIGEKGVVGTLCGEDLIKALI